MTADPDAPPPAAGRGVLFLNWRDTTHPEGGGSEVFVERVAAGLAAQGRPVTLFCAAHPGAARDERVGGIRVVRRGGRLTVYLHAWWAHLTGRLGRHQVVVDVQNGVPFFAALWCQRPLVVLVHHVHREQWRVVMPPLQARVGWWIESRLAPRLHRHARYVAVSEATRRELAGLGVPPSAVTVVHNGTTAAGPAGPVARTPYPSVCVLGRLVPHKRVELALEAAARIRPHLPGLRVLVVGQGYWEPRLREAVHRLGLQDADGRLPGRRRAARVGAPRRHRPARRRPGGIHPSPGLGPAQPAPAGAPGRGRPGACGPLHLAADGGRVRGGAGRGDRRRGPPGGHRGPGRRAAGRGPGHRVAGPEVSAIRRRPGAWSRPRTRSGWRR